MLKSNILNAYPFQIEDLLRQQHAFKTFGFKSIEQAIFFSVKIEDFNKIEDLLLIVFT